MVVRFFRSNNPSAIIFIPLLCIIFWLEQFIRPAPLSYEGAMPVYLFAAKSLENQFFLSNLISILLISGGGLLLNFIVYRHEVFTKVTYMPAFLYVILCSSLPTQTMLNPILAANLLLMLSLHFILDTYKKERANSGIFDAGFFISLASLIYFPSIVVFPLIWFSLIILRPFLWKEWVVSFLGLVVPYWFVFVLYFWRDNLDFFWNEIFLDQFHLFPPEIRSRSFSYLYIGMIILIALFSFTRFINSFASNTIKARKTLYVFIWFFIFAGLSLSLAPTINVKHLLILAIPGAVYFSNFFLSSRLSWLTEIIFWILIGTIVYARIWG